MGFGSTQQGTWRPGRLPRRTPRHPRGSGRDGLQRHGRGIHQTPPGGVRTAAYPVPGRGRRLGRGI